jgi:8-oxo-dGTP pyrophosphatase MutT (NUDIX family)
VEDIRAVLDGYLKLHPDDADALSVAFRLLDEDADLTSRTEFRGHATAGAVVLDADRRVLHIHHRALDRWLLPGGHLERGDATLRAAAARELAEETGIRPESVTPLGRSPLHVDVHVIPADPLKGEPEHPHIDVRFAFRTTADVARLQAEEVLGAAWRDLDQLDEPLRSRVQALSA